ncbi:hypothetical protein NDU88_001747 [Pleurodeles waltl]|uniref:Hyaluronidase n=1 Tax=Pleurodeles waltl TaxID=8319 RepID=A0AAV7SBR7_PLEWA|nr:hypothetical protein NDU88_001747 [Pleurodeles waltl]
MLLTSAVRASTYLGIPVFYRIFELSTLKATQVKSQSQAADICDTFSVFPNVSCERMVLGESVNGGIPQFIPLAHHLKKAAEDIRFYIPVKNQAGLAVIDWEEWRPSWVRNWASKTIYKKHSVQFVQSKNHTLTPQEAHSVAITEFEAASQFIMRETLSMAKRLRPNKQWGFFLFPECYNYDYKWNSKDYTGHCPEIEKKRNDGLGWLWRESTALYPSIYLETLLKSSPHAALYTRHRVQEAKRVSTVNSESAPLPIYVYTRVVFTDDPLTFLTQGDLVNTIGESVALGVSGVVMWGDLSFAKSARMCRTLEKYLQHVLNPYIINVTLAAKMCSQVLCQGNGACTRKHWNANDYLHLNPKNIFIRAGRHGKYSVIGHPTMEDFQQMAKKFECSCYAGHNCHHKGYIHSPPNMNICILDDICITARPESRRMHRY